MNNVFSNEEISYLCLELSLLFHAGVSAGDALSLLAEEGESAHKDLLSAMARQVDSGDPMSAALTAAASLPTSAAWWR